MSWFFRRIQAAQAEIRVQESRDPYDEHAVRVGLGVWHALFGATGSQAALSITTAPASQESQPRPVLCWASYDPEIEGIVVSPHWAASHPQLFISYTRQSPSSSCIHVSAEHLDPLLEICLEAQSAEAFEFATENASTLEEWLFNAERIIHENDITTYIPNHAGYAVPDGEGREFSYKFLSTQPTVQGYIQQNYTELFLVPPPDTSEQDCLPLSGDASLPLSTSLEISEDFLFKSVSSGPNTSRGQDAQTPRVGFTIPITALSSPVQAVDDDHSVYLATADLNAAGVLNGDWVIVQSSHSESRRVVRVIARDDIASPGRAKSSPLLLHNLSGLESDIFVLCQNLAQDHGVPLASGLTLARISSGVSTSRRFEASYLRALHDYFGRSKRLVARHDVIAVPFNTDPSLYLPDNMRETADTEAQTGVYFPLTSRPNDLVFFVVREITTEPRPSRNAQNHGGDYGYWIDSAVTRITEVGTEERRIPDILDYIGAGYLASEINAVCRQIVQFVNASMAGGSTDFGLNFSILLKGARGVGKFSIVAKVAQDLGLHLFEINCFDVVADSDVNAEAMLRFRLDTAIASAPCIIALRHIDALVRSTTSSETAKETEMSMMILEYVDKFKSRWVSTGSPVIVIATATEHARIPPEVARCFKQELTVKAPDEAERLNILTPLMIEVSSKDVSLQDIATQSAALVASDLSDIVIRAQTSLKKRTLDRGSASFDSSLTAGGDDFLRALQNVRSFYSQSIGAPKIPNVSWDDIGGLAQTRNDILDTVQLPLDHPELFAGGLKKRSGILLFGPPGTGKTLLAKAVATTCSLNFFSVKGPELLNMYIGESEANVRRLFQRARDAKPCVIFFDELDSVAPKRGNQGDSGGVMDRIVSQLLAELDGISSTDGSADVFVIGATNRPDLLDPALLRPGRFDRMLYLGVSKSHQEQADILRALTRKFKLDTSLDLDLLATCCPMNYTGADFYALCSDAMLNAMSRKVDELGTRLAELNRLSGGSAPITLAYFLTEVAKPEELDVLVSESDFQLALKDLIPSVSQSEMEHYHAVQRQFSQNI